MLAQFKIIIKWIKYKYSRIPRNSRFLSTRSQVPSLIITALIISIALYYGLFSYNVHKIIQKLFQLVSNLDSYITIFTYLFLISFPCIALSSISLLVSHNIMGFLISCDIDHIQIILVSGYIYYIEQSRKTPIRGYFFGRDLITLLCFIGLLANLYLDGIIRIYYGLIAISIFLIFLFLQVFQQSVQKKLLKMLGFKQSSLYNSTYLLTQIHNQADYLQIYNTILQNKQKINKNISQFKQILDKLHNSEQEKHILYNFGKIFISYKSAAEIQEDNQMDNNAKRIQDDWFSEDKEDQQEEEKLGQDISEKEISQNGEDKINQSASNLIRNRTLTEDYVIQQSQQEQLKQQQTILSKIFKFIFYPLYLISLAQGRIRYFLDYLCVILLIGSMFGISSACSYLTNITQNKSYSGFSLIIAIFLTIPPAKHYLKISVVKDFHFINIFLQCSIFKSTIFAILTFIFYLIDSNGTIQGSPGLLFIVLGNLATYCIFGGYLLAQKFATMKSNFRFYVALSVGSFMIRIIGEIVCNVVPSTQNL